jgi:hypothetical protein
MRGATPEDAATRQKCVVWWRKKFTESIPRPVFALQTIGN